MTRVFLDDTFQLFNTAPQCDGRHARAVKKAFVSATLTALRKPDGGVSGIGAGTSFRRLVARTLARQFGKVVEATCAPFQFALSCHQGIHGQSTAPARTTTCSEAPC